jgi:hypothetical protein
MILVYEVSEMNEDGRAKVSSTFFSTKTAAEDYSNKKLGVYSGGVEPREVFDDIKDYEKNNLEARRQRALAKLTDDDKFVLGFKP